MVQEAGGGLRGSKMWDNKKGKESCLLQLAFWNRTDRNNSCTQTWWAQHRVVECLPLPKTGSYLRKQPRGEDTGLTSCLKQQDYLVSSLPSGIRNERSWARRTANNCSPDKMDCFLKRCCKGKVSLHSVQWRSSLSGWQSVPRTTKQKHSWMNR